MPKILTLRQVADELFDAHDQAAMAKVRRMCNRGELHAVRIGSRGDRWVVRQSVLDWLAGADGPQGGHDDAA